MSRSPRAFVVAAFVVAFPFALVACGGSQDGDPRQSMRSAGGLNESRMPNGPIGDTPAPTGGLPRDKALEMGWYKHARPGEKAPSHGDKASM